MTGVGSVAINSSPTRRWTIWLGGGEYAALMEEPPEVTTGWDRIYVDSDSALADIPTA